MNNRLFLVACCAAMSAVLVAFGQASGPRSAPAEPTQAPAPKTAPSAPQPSPAASAPAALPTTVASAADERALLNRYCVSCHNEKAKSGSGPLADAARKLTLDNVDTGKVHDHAATWELVVRKMRAGMMPPAGLRRPEAGTYKSMISWLENELDRTSTPHTPPPGLHRLNRTEYANVVRDTLGLDIDPSKYLPNDDSTHGFDNIAGALGISSTLVEAYVSAAGKISRLAVGEPAHADACRLSDTGRHLAGLSHRRTAVRDPRRDARPPRVPIRR